MAGSSFPPRAKAFVPYASAPQQGNGHPGAQLGGPSGTPRGARGARPAPAGAALRYPRLQPAVRHRPTAMAVGAAKAPSAPRPSPGPAEPRRGAAPPAALGEAAAAGAETEAPGPSPSSARPPRGRWPGRPRDLRSLTAGLTPPRGDPGTSAPSHGARPPRPRSPGLVPVLPPRPGAAPAVGVPALACLLSRQPRRRGRGEGPRRRPVCDKRRALPAAPAGRSAAPPGRRAKAGARPGGQEGPGRAQRGQPVPVTFSQVSDPIERPETRYGSREHPGKLNRFQHRSSFGGRVVLIFSPPPPTRPSTFKPIALPACHPKKIRLKSGAPPH